MSLQSEYERITLKQYDDTLYEDDDIDIDEEEMEKEEKENKDNHLTYQSLLKFFYDVRSIINT